MSLIRVMWNPNLVIMFSYINLVATSLLNDSIGSTFVDFVTYSRTMIMYLALVLYPGFGKDPTKSISYISNVRLGVMDIWGISFCFKGLPILYNYHI